MELLRKMGTKKILRIISTGVPYAKNINPKEDNKVYVVDINGYIGGIFMDASNYYNNYAIVFPGTDYSSLGLGRVTLIDNTVNIGGRDYPTVTIGGMTWISENLDFKFPGLSVPTHDAELIHSPQAVYYNYDEATYGVNGNRYGLLYNGPAVEYLKNNAATLTPGWHIATEQDWDNLMTAAGGKNIAGKHLKSIAGWPTGGEGLNDLGMTFYPTGYGDSETLTEGEPIRFVEGGQDTIIWTKTLLSEHNIVCYVINTTDSMLKPPPGHSCLYHHVIRLVKDAE